MGLALPGVTFVSAFPCYSPVVTPREGGMSYCMNALGWNKSPQFDVSNDPGGAELSYEYDGIGELSGYCGGRVWKPFSALAGRRREETWKLECRCCEVNAPACSEILALGSMSCSDDNAASTTASSMSAGWAHLQKLKDASSHTRHAETI